VATVVVSVLERMGKQELSEADPGIFSWLTVHDESMSYHGRHYHRDQAMTAVLYIDLPDESVRMLPLHACIYTRTCAVHMLPLHACICTQPCTVQCSDRAACAWGLHDRAACAWGLHDKPRVIGSCVTERSVQAPLEFANPIGGPDSVPNGRTVFVPSIGDFILFPSYLPHTVPMRLLHNRAEPRISIAFNIWFNGPGLNRCGAGCCSACTHCRMHAAHAHAHARVGDFVAARSPASAPAACACGTAPCMCPC
jgi:hypothetical protein